MKSTFTMLAALLACALVQPAMARDDDDDDDDDHERRKPRTKFENNAERYKYEYRDRRCKYKYEYKYRSGKAKVEQEGDCRHVAMPRPVAHAEPLPRAVPPDPGAKRIECNREVLGAVIGGAIGAVIGSEIGENRRERRVTTVGGAVIGAVVGGAVGRSMDEADQACAAQALEYAGLKQAVTWDNPGRGTSYTITPTETLRSDNGGECRRYVLGKTSGGALQNSRGTACRQADGSWVLVN